MPSPPRGDGHAEPSAPRNREIRLPADFGVDPHTAQLRAAVHQLSMLVEAIKRGLAYTLLDEGVIEAVSLRRRGQSRGKRLFDVASVRRFLNQQIAAGRTE
jgi:hypothetical protein